MRACLRQSSAILVHSLSRFAECWGSLEAPRGGMLEVIGAVGSMAQALLLLCYFFAVKPVTDLGPTSISRLLF